MTCVNVQINMQNKLDHSKIFEDLITTSKNSRLKQENEANFNDQKWCLPIMFHDFRLHLGVNKGME